MHQHDHPSQRPPITLVILAAVMLIALGVIGRSSAPSIQAQTNPNEETVEARVIAVLDEGVTDRGGVRQLYQRLRLEILTGSRAGRCWPVSQSAQSACWTI